MGGKSGVDTTAAEHGAAANPAAGKTDLGTLLRELEPRLLAGDYVFCTVAGRYGDHGELAPLAAFQEAEGLSLLLREEVAARAGLTYDCVLRGITLGVHSSLQAVGLTAAVAGRLAAADIPANVIAARCHDHVFVPAAAAGRALAELRRLATDAAAPPGAAVGRG